MVAPVLFGQVHVVSRKKVRQIVDDSHQQTLIKGETHEYLDEMAKAAKDAALCFPEMQLCRVLKDGRRIYFTNTNTPDLDAYRQFEAECADSGQRESHDTAQWAEEYLFKLQMDERLINHVV